MNFYPLLMEVLDSMEKIFWTTREAAEGLAREAIEELGLGQGLSDADRQALIERMGDKLLRALPSKADLNKKFIVFTNVRQEGEILYSWHDEKLEKIDIMEKFFWATRDGAHGLARDVIVAVGLGQGLSDTERQALIERMGGYLLKVLPSMYCINKKTENKKSTE